MTDAIRKTKVKIFRGFWTLDHALKNPEWLFVYGDNDSHIGCASQAVIRNAKNAVGIPTKKYPSLRNISFYNDDEYDHNIRQIDKAIQHIIDISSNYKYVVFPEDGIGTGLSQLKSRAPKTYDYLELAIQRLKRKI